MQGNASCHKSASTLEYLDLKNMFLLSDWPPQSPDLNIIKNLWVTLKRKVPTRYPKNSSELWAFGKEEGENIPNEVIHKLYASIPKRLQMFRTVVRGISRILAISYLLTPLLKCRTINMLMCLLYLTIPKTLDINGHGQKKVTPPKNDDFTMLFHE